MIDSPECNIVANDSVNITQQDGETTVLGSSPESPQNGERRGRRTLSKIWILVGLGYSNFWAAACASLQAPFFPQEAEKKGVSPTIYGFIFGVFELAVMISAPVFAKMMPKVPPKVIAIGGTLAEGIVVSLFGVLDVIPPGNLYISLAFIIRILEGFASSAVATTCVTITSSEFRDSVGTSVSTMETLMGFGFIVGPVIGGALFQAGGFTLPFVICGAFSISAAVILIFVLPPVGDLEPQPPRDFKGFLFHFDILVYASAIITGLIYLGFNSATLEPHLRQFELKPAALGAIFIVSGGIYAFTAPLWGRMLDKGANPNLLCIFGSILVVIGLLFLGPLPFIPVETKLWLVILSFAISSLGVSAKVMSSFVGSLKSTCQRGFPDNVATASMVSALFTSSCSAGAFIGPSIGGALLDAIGFAEGTLVLFGMELVFFVVMFIIVVVQWSRHRTNDPERAPLLPPPMEENKDCVADG